MTPLALQTPENDTPLTLPTQNVHSLPHLVLMLVFVLVLILVLAIGSSEPSLSQFLAPFFSPCVPTRLMLV